MPNELVQVGRIKGLSTRMRLGDTKTADVRKALDKTESKVQKLCNELENPLHQVGCRIGSIAALGSLRDELAPELEGIKLSGLGIIVGPREDCEKGFEKIVVTSPLNKKVHVCRLAPGYRKKDAPKGKPAHKGPLRRLTKFGPGVEHDEILPRREHKTRKAERRLTR